MEKYKTKQIEENGKLYQFYIYDDGHKEWHWNEELHRENGPAVEYSNGYKEWWLNDYLHREDGPAVEYANGSKEWYLDDIEYTETEFKQEVSKRKLKKLLGI